MLGTAATRCLHTTDCASSACCDAALSQRSSATTWPGASAAVTSDRAAAFDSTCGGFAHGRMSTQQVQEPLAAVWKYLWPPTVHNHASQRHLLGEAVAARSAGTGVGGKRQAREGEVARRRTAVGKAGRCGASAAQNRGAGDDTQARMDVGAVATVSMIWQDDRRTTSKQDSCSSLPPYIS